MKQVPYLDAPGPLGFAHRGGAAAGDENTTAAFARAADLGYRYIETDTHATADGVAVVFHDDTLQRLLGRPGRMIDLRWADLRTERVGGAAAVPRLDEVLDAHPGIRFNIDAKTEHAVAPTVEVIERLKAHDRVLLASFSSARLRRLRRLAGPAVATSMGMREVAALYGSYRLGRRYTPLEAVVAVQIPPRYGRLALATPAFVGYCHRMGLQVHLWTIDDPAQIAHFLDIGVDGIMTDQISVLREVYLERGIWP
ncbi:glycerophosphodiester phosphodiesterase [Dactylosporangium vinaceum]|uniref:Glycerophosphodiester phosphodiesterase family protein n=1 Tax=Dactylosporangium vinaceum TaxID=53362 RepID=A0ABV5MCD4_9ACTN|nr:glycerophosphodiester phosphodiesterase family protein [Dactylosporangium vinaceum]UAB92141.1 glycerophosphodiester phosphodiesterase [Dactylosporangium vinaceum]